MKKWFFSGLCVLLCIPGAAVASSAEGVGPFGLRIGKTSYEESLGVTLLRNWKTQEYEKRHLNVVRPNDPQRGRNTFLKVSAKDMEGIRSIFLFFGPDSVLDAVMITLDPGLFGVLVERLDAKYPSLEKNLIGESASGSYPFALWEREGVYIELQNPRPGLLRLIYVDKLLHENYRDFLHKAYEAHRPREEIRRWMNEL